MIAGTPGTDQASAPVMVTGGVDTHADTHTAAALDATGRMLGHATFSVTAAGYGALLVWLRSFGMVVAVGVQEARGALLAETLMRTGVLGRGRRPAASRPPVPRGVPAVGRQSGRVRGVVAPPSSEWRGHVLVSRLIP